MRIATLVFRRHGKRMVMSARDRADTILDIATRFEPDLLLCGGFALDHTDDVWALARRYQRRVLTGTIIIDVRWDDRVAQLLKDKQNRQVSRLRNAVYRIDDQDVVYLGRQIVQRSDDFAGAKPCIAKRLQAMAHELHHRRFIVQGRSVNMLCCGELNILRGRNHVACRDDTIATILTDTDIVLNFTHDRMGHHGTVNAKRRWLSNDGRIYVSASNWNTKTASGQSQSQFASLLSTFWHDGHQQSWPLLERSVGYYEFRARDT